MVPAFGDCGAVRILNGAISISIRNTNLDIIRTGSDRPAGVRAAVISLGGKYVVGRNCRTHFYPHFNGEALQSIGTAIGDVVADLHVVISSIERKCITARQHRILTDADGNDLVLGFDVACRAQCKGVCARISGVRRVVPHAGGAVDGDRAVTCSALHGVCRRTVDAARRKLTGGDGIFADAHAVGRDVRCNVDDGCAVVQRQVIAAGVIVDGARSVVAAAPVGIETGLGTIELLVHVLLNLRGCQIGAPNTDFGHVAVEVPSRPAIAERNCAGRCVERHVPRIVIVKRRYGAQKYTVLIDLEIA